MKTIAQILAFGLMLSASQATDQKLTDHVIGNDGYSVLRRLHSYSLDYSTHNIEVCTTDNIGFSNAYQHRGLDNNIPQVPLLHRYHPTPDENFSSAIFAPYAAKLLPEMVRYLPNEVCQFAVNQGANLHDLSNVDIFLSIQGYPGTVNLNREKPEDPLAAAPLLFRPQYWGIPDAPAVAPGRYNKAFTADITFLSNTMKGLLYNGAGIGNTVRADFSLHDEGDNTALIASPGAPEFQGLEANKSFWSITKIIGYSDGQPAGRIAITLHNLVTPSVIDNLANLRQGGQLSTVGELINAIDALTGELLFQNQPKMISREAFNTSKPNRHFLSTGFADPEIDGTKTNGDIALIDLTSIPLPQGDVELRFQISGIVPEGKMVQPLIIELNDAHAGIINTTRDEREYSLTLPKTMTERAGGLALLFNLPDAIQQSDGSKHAIKLKSLEVNVKPTIPAVQNNTQYETRLGGNGSPYLVDGWAVPEAYAHDGYTWSSGYSSSLLLPGVQAGRDAQLFLSGYNFKDQTSVILYANGQRVGQVLPRTIGVGEFSQVSIPGALINSPDLRLDFIIENPEPFPSFEHEVGFALRAFRIEQ